MKYDLSYIPDDQNVFICGMTGCGKSVLAEVYLAGKDNVIKVDTKQEYFSRKNDGEEPWQGLVEGEDYEVCHTLLDVQNSEFSRIIYVVPWDEQNSENYDKLCEYCFINGDWHLWIDEMMSFFDNAMTNIKFLRAIYTAGRTRRVTVWGCTQRPSGIPAVCIANSYHFFVFAMPQPQDRKKLSDVTGCQELLIKPPKYTFWYYREGMDEGEPIQAKLKL